MLATLLVTLNFGSLAIPGALQKGPQFSQPIYAEFSISGFRVWAKVLAGWQQTLNPM